MRRGSPRRMRMRGAAGKPDLVVVLVCFALAAAAFLGSTFYADARLERVARMTHEVSENAMPSLAEIGTMQRELADIHFAVDALAAGRETDGLVLDAHLQELRKARGKYESLPQFPGEPEAWARARPMLDQLPVVVASVRSDARAGSLVAARHRVQQELAPAEAAANAALLEVRALNLQQGTLAAQRADRAWSRTRAVSLSLDFACAMFTGGLAVLAVRSARRSVAAEARRANELDAFAARVAHDIRGPLTPPKFALQRLARELDADSPHRTMVDRGVRGLQRAEALVGDLLTFARAAAAPDTGASASLRDVVAGAMQDLEQEANAARVRLEVDELPAAVARCTAGVLASIIGNLVGNAIKYMPADATTRVVSVRAWQNGERVRVEVADTGTGLSEQQQERIFEPYVRGDASRPGLGLGLATVKRLVTAHAGDLGVRSRAGAGAVFWFELPCVADAAREGASLGRSVQSLP